MGHDLYTKGAVPEAKLSREEEKWPVYWHLLS